ncbi:MAG: ankyrin repeat domain-containing protein [Phycisphaerales bacterium]|nr:ankyrin repeat domain-containing protein [Phycisphaerales bacterium]
MVQKPVIRRLWRTLAGNRSAGTARLGVDVAHAVAQAFRFNSSRVPARARIYLQYAPIIVVSVSCSIIGCDRQGGTGAAGELDIAAEFLTCVDEGDVDGVKSLLTRVSDVDLADSAGWTPLMHALKNGHEEVARLLLDAGASLSSTTADGSSPLSVAVETSTVGCVRLLLESGGDVGVAIPYGLSLMHFAVLRDDAAIVELLAEHGADMNARDVNGLSPLRLAVLCARPAVVEILLANGAEIHDPGVRGIDIVCSAVLSVDRERTAAECVAILHFLADAGASVDGRSRYMTPLMHATIGGNVDIVSTLLELSANRDLVSFDGKTALEYALDELAADETQSRKTIVELLLGDTSVGPGG